MRQRPIRAVESKTRRGDGAAALQAPSSAPDRWERTKGGPGDIDQWTCGDEWFDRQRARERARAGPKPAAAGRVRRSRLALDPSQSTTAPAPRSRTVRL